MQPTNLLIILSDEHNPGILGCAGNPLVSTPNLDALAARGTRFTAAYTTCPICVPARAAFAVGRYVHQVGYWDNSDGYEGAVPSWHHVLRGRGHRVTAIGKLHFRGRPGDDHGFSEEIVPMHIVDGIGDVKGLVRENIPVRKGGEKLAKYSGPGESTYAQYDRDIASRAQIWLHDEAPRFRDRPWVLFVSLVMPHFPLTAPPHWYYRYRQRGLPMPKQYRPEERPHHPYTDEYARVVDYGPHFETDEQVQRALAGYYGMVSTLDENVGHVLQALASAGLADSTRVIYTSDHGDNLGARGLWGKSTFYEESAGVPLIIAGPGIAAGAVVDTPSDQTDVYPTVLETVGATPGADHAASAGSVFRGRDDAGPTASEPHPGISLYRLAAGEARERTVLSEYHAIGSIAGAYMVRWDRWKYCHYVAYRPQLFDLATDPEERVDLAGEPRHAAVVAEGERRLRRFLDPLEVDARAKRRQRASLEAYGGREAALARGDLGFSPAPGTRPEYN